METLGTALHIAKSGRLIIRAEKPVKPGSFVLDEKGNKIAKVHELIGPATAPFVSAAPLSERVKRVIGKRVYASRG